MVRSFSHCVVVSAFLLLPAGLMAGGPPYLCLPVEGVTAENVQRCTELLNAKLGDKIWRQSNDQGGAKLTQRANQWYLAFYMEKDVRLSDVNSALEDSAFSLPKDRLRLFGHVILEIETLPAARQDLLSALNGLLFVAVEESKSQENLLSVTLDMPYPVDMRRSHPESVGWDTFRRNDLNSNSSRTPVTLAELPGYKNIREVVSQHNASLKDIRWSTNYTCRTVGGVAEAAFPAGKWNVAFANGVTEVCDIDSEGEAAVAESQRGSHGRVAVKSGSFVVTFHDDRVERWTSVGKRFVVEHWFPGSAFPSTAPVLGIAERAP